MPVASVTMGGRGPQRAARQGCQTPRSGSPVIGRTIDQDGQLTCLSRSRFHRTAAETPQPVGVDIDTRAHFPGPGQSHRDLWASAVWAIATSRLQRFACVWPTRRRLRAPAEAGGARPGRYQADTSNGSLTRRAPVYEMPETFPPGSCGTGAEIHRDHQS